MRVGNREEYLRRSTNPLQYVFISYLLNVLGRKLGMSDRRITLNVLMAIPKPRTGQGPPHSIPLAVGVQLQHPSRGRVKFVSLTALVQKASSCPYLA